MHAPSDKPLNLSQLLGQLVDIHPEDCITPDDLATHLRDRVWGGLLLIFAAINLLPLPPGSTWVTGLPLIIVSAQMALGRSRPWFPARIRHRALTKSEIGAILAKLLPWERRVEYLLRPRLWWLTNHRGMRAIGLVSLVLSIILWLPIPLGNHLPAASMTVFALALIYRDGLAALAGYVLSLVSLVVVSGLIVGTVMTLLYVIRTYLPAVLE